MTKEAKLLAEFEKERQDALKEMEQQQFEQAQKDLDEMYKQAKKEAREWEKEKADAERQAHLRGEYTEADYQRDLALYQEALKRQKQR